VATAPLAVDVVYTATDLSGRTLTMDVQRVEGRPSKFAGGRKAANVGRVPVPAWSVPAGLAPAGPVLSPLSLGGGLWHRGRCRRDSWD
jgi:hypothetical protein